MNPIPELTALLKQLRLSGILDSLEARNREAIDRKLAYTDFLSLLIHDEVARRDHKKLDIACDAPISGIKKPWKDSTSTG
jgi:hypothetical protein